MDKPVIEYPCEWSFKIIGSDEEVIRKGVEECLPDSTYNVSKGNTSSSGKYATLNLETVVRNEGERNRIFEALKNIPTVKMIL